MKNKFLTKILGATLGLAMAIGVGVGVVANNKVAKEVNAANSTTTMTWGTVEQTNVFSFSASGDTYLEYSYGGADNMAANSTDLRMFANTWLTIKAKSAYSSTVKIKNLSITAKNSSSSNANYLYYNASTGAKVTAAGEGVTTLTWAKGTGVVDPKDANFGDGLSSVTIARATSGNNIRISSIVVTYEYTPVSIVEATSMSISPEGPANLVVGETVTFTPTLSGGSGLYERTISWVSTNTSVVASPENSEDGESVTVTALASGSTTITGTVVSPGSASASFVVNVKALSGIAVTTPPSKTVYFEDEAFDSTGMVVTATFTDSSTEDVTSSCTFTPNPLTYGTTSVTVSYAGFNTTQAVTVNRALVKTDVLTSSDGSATDSNYSTKTNIAKNSVARYTMATNLPSAGKFGYRVSGSNSGIVSTTSGGTIKTVSVQNCQADRTIEVYGSNSAYENPDDLFAEAKRGTKLGELTSSSSSLNVSGNYAYVGVKSKSGAVNMEGMTFVWNVSSPEPVSTIALPTKTSLSYSYTNEADVYTYTNAVVRFAGLISTAQWDEIDTNSHVIQGYGMFFSTASFLGDQTIKGLYNVTRNGRTIDDAIAQLCYENSVRNFYRPLSEKASPDIASDVQKDGAVGDHYIWYLSKTVTESLTTSYTAVAYIRIANDIVFLNEVTASAKSIAHDLIESGAYAADAAGGSLNHLANLS